LRQPLSQRHEPRSEWDPKTFEEHPFDLAHAMQVFEESNERLRAAEIAK
jgi:hypothetical protein